MNENKLIEKVAKEAKMDLNKRWEEGTPHHTKAELLARLIGEIDYAHGGDYFCFKYGGDGDNGEHLSYILSEIFEQGLLEKLEQEIKIMTSNPGK
jgi:hypothetical protein